MTTRQQQFRESFRDEFSRMKKLHGSGVHSWAEGMTRRIARRIARDRARKAMRGGK